MKLKKLPRSISLLGFLVLISSLLLNVYLLSQSKTSDQSIEVLEVLDGDTILLDQKVRLRLRHVDAPELRYCGGEEAKQLLTNLVKGKSIQIKEEIRDQFGRPLGLVYVGDTLINEKMLSSGWSRFHHDTTSQKDSLKKIADKVKAEKKGLYSLCIEKENSENPKCNIKGNIDRTRKIYYLPDCAQYKFTIVEKDIGEQWFCTEKEAEAAGFTRAETCK